MKISCALIVSLAVAGAGAQHASALNAPRTLHHSRSQHIVETHRAAHHSAAKAAPAVRPVGVHHASKLGSGAATIRRASLHGRHHRYYERFTASSFATSDQVTGD